MSNRKYCLVVLCCSVGPLITSHVAHALDAPADQAQQLSEVIVTAEKREERLQDVPVPMTAISAQSLVDSNQLRLQDYFSSVPGLNLSSGGRGDALLSIRGITTGGDNNPTVAVLVNDVPISGTTGITDNGNFIPDIDPSDLQRIEVLRGPQGTLYGASSLGGIVKYVTQDPSTDQLAGRTQTETFDVQNGNGLGYGVRGAINVPITDALAVRVSAFTRKDPGYIDNPFLDLQGANEDHAEGGHFSLLWKPSADFSIKIGALVQQTVADGLPLAESGLGDLQQDYLPGTGQWNMHDHLYTAIIKAKLGSVNFSSISGYNVNADFSVHDLSLSFGPGIYYNNDARTEKFSQEFRFSSSIGHALDWTGGLFYTHEFSPVNQALYQQNVTGAPFTPGYLIDFNFPSTYMEYAAFADLTVHFTDQFDVQVGGRESHNRQVYQEVDSGPETPTFDGAPSPYAAPRAQSEDTSFTYLVTPRFRISPDLMVYARFASGFRPGGPNPDAQLFHLPLSFGPDTTQNYEVGVKADVLDHKLTLDGSIYYINWKNIQVTAIGPHGGAYFTNAGDAKSEGIELSAQAKPFEATTVAGWVSWNEAVLTQTFPASSGIVDAGDGSRLPYASRYSANLSVEQQFNLGPAVGYVQVSASYVGDRQDEFSTLITQPRLNLPGYVQPNALAGVRYNSWTLNLYANNLSNRRGLLEADYPGGGGTPIEYNYIRPRTIGVSLAYVF